MPALPVMLLVVVVALPAFFNVGPLRLSPARVLLLVMFFPAVMRWMKGPKVIADWLVLGYCLWTTLSLLIVHGAGEIWQFAGITFVEAFGAYMIGRAYIGGPADFSAFTRFFHKVLLVFAPMAMLEAVAGIRPLTMLFSPVFSTFWWAATGYEKRLGMSRAQVGFEHPILWGVYAATGFALFFFARRASGARGGAGYAAVSAVGTFFSLSMGGLINIVLQSGLIAYDYILRRNKDRWKLSLWLAAAAYVVVDLISNRNPFEVATTYLVFDSYTAYYRILIFQFGMDNVIAHPIFGIGLNDWARPSWMPPSVDNFWLLTAMRGGVPAFLFLAFALILTVVRNGRRNILDPVAADQRKALNFVLVGLGIAISTVHLWGGVYYHVMFLLGAAGWMQHFQGGDAGSPPPSGRAARIGTGRRAPRGGAEDQAPAPAAPPATLPVRPPRPGAPTPPGRDRPVRPARLPLGTGPRR
ncbi:MAG: O-antigen ligase family protein [Pseudomonadota bacterium]|nr:O-antigen ligase family protein [Pseudomonadota bacterium]MEE3099668.1 O-antigen ligase family protein [Pseudomonadota bacterium]